MRYESAELTKIAINCFLVAQLSMTNTLSEICEHMGADWSEIAPALYLDGRIGPKAYLKPGLGFAGGNLERDLASVMRMSAEHNTDAGLISSALRNSEHRKVGLAHVIQAALASENHDDGKAQNDRARVAFLGLAYKENTHSTKNAPSLALLNALSPTKVNAFDPIVKGDALGFSNLNMFDHWRAAVSGVDCVVIVTPWPEFSEISLSELAKEMGGKFLIDPFGVFDNHDAASSGLRYFRLGMPLPESLF
jgi:UDPglucose 6-dehydrogenase